MTRSDLTTLTLAALLLLLIAAPRSASDPALSQGGLTGQGRSGAPPASGTSLLRPAAPSVAKASERPDSVVTASDAPTHTAADVTIEGIASWVAPRYGYATWYDDGPGFYGAVRSWHYGDEPYAVQVCRADKPTTCTHVVVRDYCACGSRKGEPTLIDLSPAAFRELAALSRGVVRVTVDDVGVALPETDQEEP